MNPVDALARVWGSRGGDLTRHRRRSGADVVGDGVNDAVYVARPGVAAVAELLDGTERTLRVIRRNLVFSLGYNAVAVALAMTGHLDPVVAVILMPLSSVTVIASSFRARTFAAPAIREGVPGGPRWR